MNITPVIAQKSPYPIEVEKGKSYCASVVKVRNNPSVTLLIKTHPFALSYTKKRKQKKCIFVDANLHLTNLFVMVHIQKFRNIQ
jgi:hypothetical protein